MTSSDQKRWNAKYSGVGVLQRVSPDQWLLECIESLAPGRALELACGLGHNALALAQAGWMVDAVDISRTGLQRARELAERCCADVNWLEADLDQYRPRRQFYDLVIVFRFLDRRTIPPIVADALRTDGWLVYETFTVSQLERAGNHIRNTDFLLAEGELPGLFPEIEPVAFREVELDDRCVARLLGRKRSSGHVKGTSGRVD